MADILTGREIALLGFFILVREGIPWLLKTFFPAIWGDRVERRKSADLIKREEMQYRQQMEESELALKREIEEKQLQMSRERDQREYEFRREIAERDAVIEARNFKLLESIEKQISRLVEVVGANTMQLSVVSGAVATLQKDQNAYFAEGRKFMAKKSKPSDKV